MVTTITEVLNIWNEMGVFSYVVRYLWIGIVVYVLSSLIFYALAKKAKDNSPGLSWIPIIGPTLISFRSSKMHWWPWLLLILFFIPLVNIFAWMIFSIFSIVWLWKLMEAVGRPGWWALLVLIPFVGIIVLAVAAWGK